MPALFPIRASQDVNVPEGPPPTPDDRRTSPQGDVSPTVAGHMQASPGPPHARSEHVPGDDPQPKRMVLGLTNSDRLFLAAASSAILLLITFHLWQRPQSGQETIEIQRLEPAEYTFRIDINQATWVEWMQLDGIGEIMGKRIVQDREERGPFASADDVQRVAGIGPKTMAAIRQHLDCADCPPVE